MFAVLERIRKTTPRKEVEKKPPTGNELLEAVALALEARGGQRTAGYEGIEYRGQDDVMAAPVTNTVFGWIAEELAELGVRGDLETVGGTLEALGIRGGYNGVRDWNDNPVEDYVARHLAAHAIGCNCHGAVITADDAATRVRCFMN